MRSISQRFTLKSSKHTKAQDRHSSFLRMEKFVNYAEQHSFSSPYMLTDLEALTVNARHFRENMPGVKIFYALKCFSDEEVITALDPNIDGYDVASVDEIKKLLDLGVDVTRMALSNPVKSEKTLQEAKKLGVQYFAYQSYNELIKIKRNVKGAKVYLRVTVDDSTSHLSFSSKFGCNPSMAVKLLKEAEQLGLDPVGITFHVGSQAVENNVWPQAIASSVEIINEAKKQNIDLEILNIGGGFPVGYFGNEPSFSEVSETITSALEKHKTLKSIRKIAEPGRFLVADSSAIVTTIIGVEERDNATWLFLDVGAFQAFIEIFEFGHFPYPVYSYDHIKSGLPHVPTKKYVITGPSCDSYDTMATGVELPLDLAVGNKLIIGMVGAYTVVYGSNFNGFSVPERHFFKS